MKNGVLFDQLGYLANQFSDKKARISKGVNETMTALGRFLSHCFLSQCENDEKAPPIFSMTYRLIADDFSPIFLATYGYYFLTYHYQLHQNKIPELLQYPITVTLHLLSVLLWLFTETRNIQFIMRYFVLSFQFPKAFYEMNGITKINNAVCNRCNQLRFTKGEIRSFLQYYFRLFYFKYLIARIPIIGPVISFLYCTLFTGQMIFEFAHGSAGICEVHRQLFYDEHLESVFAIGLLHQGIYFFTYYASINTIALFQFILTSVSQQNILLSELCILNPFLSGLMHIPFGAFENFFNLVSMFYLAGLSYYLHFPNPMTNTNRFSFYFFSRTIFEIIMEGTIVNGKKELKRWLQFIAEKKEGGDNAVVEIITTKEILIKTRMGIAYQHIHHACASFATLSFGKNVLNNTFIQTLASYFLPAMLSSPDGLIAGILQDRIIYKYSPRILVDIKNALISIKNFQPTLNEMAAWGKKINKICSHRAVQWTLKGAGFVLASVHILSDIPEKFTYNYIVNEVPKYLDDLTTDLNLLYRLNCIKSDTYDVYINKFNAAKKNLDVLKKLLNELPGSISDDLLSWMRTAEFYFLLDGCIDCINAKIDFLDKKEYAVLIQNGYDVLDPIRPEAMDWSEEETMKRLHDDYVSEEKKNGAEKGEEWEKNDDDWEEAKSATLSNDTRPSNNSARFLKVLSNKTRNPVNAAKETKGARALANGTM